MLDLTPEQIGRSYDAIAERWASEEFPRDNGIAPHERAIGFVSGRGAALDIGCGCSGRILDLMLERGFEPEGVDVSERMVELARQRHPQVPIHHGDICEFAFRRGYDLVSAWDSKWHIAPVARQEALLARVLARLNPGGVFIFTSGGTDAPDIVRDEAMGVPMVYAAPGIPGLLELIGEAGAACRHLEFDQWPERHLFVIAQRPVEAAER